MRESRQGAVVATAALDVEGDPALPRRAFTVKRSKFCWRLKQKSSPTKVYPSCISSSIFLLDTILFFTINRLITDWEKTSLIKAWPPCILPCHCLGLVRGEPKPGVQESTGRRGWRGHPGQRSDGGLGTRQGKAVFFSLSLTWKLLFAVFVYLYLYVKRLKTVRCMT